MTTTVTLADLQAILATVFDHVASDATRVYAAVPAVALVEAFTSGPMIRLSASAWVDDDWLVVDETAVRAADAAVLPSLAPMMLAIGVRRHRLETLRIAVARLTPPIPFAASTAGATLDGGIRVMIAGDDIVVEHERRVLSAPWSEDDVDATVRRLVEDACEGRVETQDKEN